MSMGERVEQTVKGIKMNLTQVKYYTRVLFLIPCTLILLTLFLVSPELGRSTTDRFFRTSKNVLTEISDDISDMYATRIFSEADKILDVKDKYVFSWSLRGSLFNETGRSKDLRDNLTSSLIHSFSPDIEQSAASKFVDPAKDQVYFANSPAFVFHKGHIILVIRIWLQYEKYDKTNIWPSNRFSDNYFYTRTYNRRFQPLDDGHIMGIPTPKWYIGDGPIEPRVVVHDDEILVTFNTGVSFNKTTHIDYTIWWHYNKQKPIVPKIKGFNPMLHRKDNELPCDKHWAAYVYNKELYFIHSLDPLRILKCEMNGSCVFHHYEGSREVGKAFDDRKTHLRGGTPFEQYKGEYFVGFAHSTLYKKSTGYHRYYSTHLVVLNAKSNRFVYCSAAIEVHREVMMSAPMVRRGHIEDYFIFPVGIILEDEDTITMGVHINDFSSVAIRLRGLKKLMTKVMHLDRAAKTNHGPPPDSLQQYIMDIEHIRTGIEFTT